LGTKIVKRSDRLDVCSLQAFRAVHHVKLNLLAFSQGLEARRLDSREVSEQIAAAAFRGDETKAFCVIEPLNSTSCHYISFHWVLPKTLVKAEDPPNDRLNQVRNYSLILHRYYLSLNVERIILEKIQRTKNFINFLSQLQIAAFSERAALTESKRIVPSSGTHCAVKSHIVPERKYKTCT